MTRQQLGHVGCPANFDFVFLCLGLHTVRVPVFKYVIPTPLVPFFAHFPPRSPISAFPSPLALLLSPTLTMPRCVFLPDNGAFFINYVITTALLGTALDMLRPGSLFLYTIRLFFSQSEPARVHIMKVRASSSPKHSPQSGPWEGVRKGDS